MTGEEKERSGFGRRGPRFGLVGFHPKYLETGGGLGTPAGIGPGSYDVCVGDFSDKVVGEKGSSGGWKRQMEAKMWSAIPHFMCKEAREKEWEQVNNRGPGYYFKDLSSLNPPKKDASTKGILDSRVQRFKGVSDKHETPGPGYYGVPPERNFKKRFGSIVLLGSEEKSRYKNKLEYGVGPGSYDKEGSIEQLLKKKGGKKGPFECFSLDRNKPIRTGHRSVLPSHSLGPGQYNVRPIFSKSAGGKFSCNRKLVHSDGPPGPGHYDPKLVDSNFPRNLPSFLSSTSRTRGSTTFFSQGNFNSVGPGRYNHQQLFGNSKSGHQSIFRSRTGNLDSDAYNILKERLKVKPSSLFFAEA